MTSSYGVSDRDTLQTLTGLLWLGLGTSHSGLRLGVHQPSSTVVTLNNSRCMQFLRRKKSEGLHLPKASGIMAVWHMYIYMHMYMYMYTHFYIHTYIHTYIHPYIHILIFCGSCRIPSLRHVLVPPGGDTELRQVPLGATKVSPPEAERSKPSREPKARPGPTLA